MKKQEVLEAMRNAAITGYINSEYMNKESEKRRIAGSLSALIFTASNLFGFDSEEAKEFKYYFKNRFEPMPQPKG